MTEDEDEPVARDKHGNPLASNNTDGDDGEQREPGGFRTWGKSKDHRDDLPRVAIGMLVTRDGILVRVWCWPGYTSDSKLIRQVKDDMRDWCLSKVIWVADHGFTSAANRRYREIYASRMPTQRKLADAKQFSSQEAIEDHLLDELIPMKFAGGHGERVMPWSWTRL